jgi:type III restriction enzyme
LEIKFPRVGGYRIELPNEELRAEFNDDSILNLTPDLIGATITKNAAIIGEHVDLTLAHTADIRPSQVLYELTSHLLLNKWRDNNGDVQLHLFGQMKRIARQWLETCLKCSGNTYPAQLKYKTLADLASERIIAAIRRSYVGDRQITVVLDPYNPTGSSMQVHYDRKQGVDFA